MPRFHRYYIPHGLIFITGVTHQRTAYFREPKNIDLLWETMRNAQAISPFRLLAYVILPDHLHFLMRTPQDQPNFSRVINSIKRNYSLNHKKAHQVNEKIQGWQSRFWDHIIRDEDDLVRHIDYIHWNPVKHGDVSDPANWAQSTFQHWVDLGYYPPSWQMDDGLTDRTSDWGE